MKDIVWPEINKNTPLEEVRYIHKDIWNFVTKYGYKPITPYRNDCVLCEYAISQLPDGIDSSMRCYYCPADWPDRGRCTSYEDDGLYDKWYESECDTDESINLSKKIRDIPFKDLVE